MKKSIMILTIVAAMLVAGTLTGCEKSKDNNSIKNTSTPTHKDPPSRPSVSIYDAIEWGNDEQVHAHFYYKTATLDGEKQNYPPIFVAIAKDQPHIIKQLLSYGENPNRTCREDMIIGENLGKYSPGAIRSEISALHFAIKHGNYDAAKVLIENGANPQIFGDYKGGRDAPLNHCGADFELTSALIKAGADVNFRGYRGYTPLHNLIDHGIDDYTENRRNEALKVAEMLIDAGADVNARDKDGFTPIGRMDKFPSYKFPEFERLLKENGGH